MPHLAHLIAAVACAAPAFALSLEDLGRDGAEAFPNHHVRASFGVIPTSANSTGSANGGPSMSNDFDWDDGTRFTLDYVYQGRVDGRFGLGLGVGFASDSWQRTDGSVTTDMSVNGVRIEPQLVFRPARWLGLEVGLPLGVGAAQLSASSGNLSYDIDGLGTSYGVLVRPVVLIGSHLELFVEGGWISSTVKTSGTVLGIDIDADVSSSGGYGAFGIGAAF